MGSPLVPQVHFNDNFMIEFSWETQLKKWIISNRTIFVDFQEWKVMKYFCGGDVNAKPAKSLFIVFEVSDWNDFLSSQLLQKS